MASNLTPLRRGRTRAPKTSRRAFVEGKPVENLLRPLSRQKWGTRKKGKLIKLANNAYAVERSFRTTIERLAYVQAVRKLRQFCKNHPFSSIEFSPMNVKTVDGKGNRVWEQAVFAPSIDEVAVGFSGDKSKRRTMSPYTRLLLQKIVRHGIEPKKISSLALKAVMGDLTTLSDALFREGIRVNLGTDYRHILVRDYNPKTGKLVVTIAGDVTDPYSIF